MLAQAFASGTIEHPRFARLAAVLATVLERNVSTDAVVRFKLTWACGPAVAEALERPELCTMRIDFEPDFIRALTTVIRGINAVSKPAAYAPLNNARSKNPVATK